MGSLTNNYDEINAKMARVAPELASEYARYPLKRKAWVELAGKSTKGEPCFIKGEGKKEQGKKLDYVYGAGPVGYGYYHLLTRDAYVNLYNRFKSEAPIGCCAFTKVARQEATDHDDVVRIMYNRSVGSIPDDQQAAADAINISRGTAKAWYNMEQNEQLIVGAIRTVVIVATS